MEDSNDNDNLIDKFKLYQDKLDKLKQKRELIIKRKEAKQKKIKFKA